MFEFFFKYPSIVFSKGQFVLLGPWPKWLLAVLLLGDCRGAGRADVPEICLLPRR